MGMIKTFETDTDIESRKVVTFGAGNRKATLATAVANPLIGVTTDIGTQSNGRVDVIMGGTALVKSGGTIVRGEKLTTDATGNVIAVSAGTDRVIGIAMESGVADDVISVLINQG